MRPEPVRFRSLDIHQLLSPSPQLVPAVLSPARPNKTLWSASVCRYITHEENASYSNSSTCVLVPQGPSWLRNDLHSIHSYVIVSLLDDLVSLPAANIIRCSQLSFTNLCNVSACSGLQESQACSTSYKVRCAYRKGGP